MRKSDLSGAGVASTTDDRARRGRVVRRAERPQQARRREPAACVGRRARDRGDEGDFERLARLERRQQCGQPLREHALAATGRTDEQQAVAAGRGDFERALAERLAADVGETQRGWQVVVHRFNTPRLVRCGAALEDRAERQQARRGDRSRTRQPTQIRRIALR